MAAEHRAEPLEGDVEVAAQGAGLAAVVERDVVERAAAAHKQQVQAAQDRAVAATQFCFDRPAERAQIGLARAVIVRDDIVPAEPERAQLVQPQLGQELLGREQLGPGQLGPGQARAAALALQGPGYEVAAGLFAPPYPASRARQPDS